MNFDKILIPLDGSRLAEAILRVILQIAGPLALEAVPVRVVQPSRSTLMARMRSVTRADLRFR